MKVSIDGIDVFQLAVEQIMCCDWIVTFQSCPVQGLLACWPLTAKPRLELVARALPCLGNFIVRSFQLTGFSNPFTSTVPGFFKTAFKLSDNVCKPCLVSLTISAWFCCSCIKIWANISSAPPAACGLPEAWAPPPGLIGEPLIADWGRSQTTYATDPWIVLQVLACSCKHPLNESQAQQPLHNSLPTTNQSWSGRSKPNWPIKDYPTRNPLPLSLIRCTAPGSSFTGAPLPCKAKVDGVPTCL